MLWRAPTETHTIVLLHYAGATGTIRIPVSRLPSDVDENGSQLYKGSLFYVAGNIKTKRRPFEHFQFKSGGRTKTNAKNGNEWTTKKARFLLWLMYNIEKLNENCKIDELFFRY